MRRKSCTILIVSVDGTVAVLKMCAPPPPHDGVLFSAAWKMDSSECVLIHGHVGSEVTREYFAKYKWTYLLYVRDDHK
jgi:hypothetical protein